MSDDELPPPRGPKIPGMMWAAFGVIMVLVFIIAVAMVGRA